MKRRSRALALPLLAAAAASVVAPAASPDASGLAWTFGDWTGVRRDGADGSERPIVLAVRPILGGAGRFEELEVTGAGAVYRGFAMDAYDRSRGHWIRQYANSSGGVASIEGVVETPARSVWRSVTPGRTRESRLVSERHGEDRWVRTMHVSEDGGETWRVLWSDHLRRAVASP